jgi:hypothetical protein
MVRGLGHESQEEQTIGGRNVVALQKRPNNFDFSC